MEESEIGDVLAQGLRKAYSAESDRGTMNWLFLFFADNITNGISELREIHKQGIMDLSENRDFGPPPRFWYDSLLVEKILVQ